MVLLKLFMDARLAPHHACDPGQAVPSPAPRCHIGPLPFQPLLSPCPLPEHPPTDSCFWAPSLASCKLLIKCHLPNQLSSKIATQLHPTSPQNTCICQHPTSSVAILVYCLSLKAQIAICMLSGVHSFSQILDKKKMDPGSLLLAPGSHTEEASTPTVQVYTAGAAHPRLPAGRGWGSCSRSS